MATLAIAAVTGAFQVYQGAQAKKLKGEEAKGYRGAAVRRMAAGTAEAAEERRNQEFMYSRGLAVAAASGGGAGDPGVIRLLGDIEGEGKYRTLMRIWQAQNDAEGLEFRADQAEQEGDAYYKAGVVNGISSAFSAYTGFGRSSGGSPAKKTIGGKTAGGSTAAAVTRRATTAVTIPNTGGMTR